MPARTSTACTESACTEFIEVSKWHASDPRTRQTVIAYEPKQLAVTKTVIEKIFLLNPALTRTSHEPHHFSLQLTSITSHGIQVLASPSPTLTMQIGRVPKWTKGTDCKSVIRRFESDLGLFRPFIRPSHNPARRLPFFCGISTAPLMDYSDPAPAPHFTR
jgi:hypothetical protein